MFTKQTKVNLLLDFSFAKVMSNKENFELWNEHITTYKPCFT